MAWLASLTERARSIVEDLMIGERALDVANKYRMSAARVSQKRRACARRRQQVQDERCASFAKAETVLPGLARLLRRCRSAFSAESCGHCLSKEGP
jgi:hypothetical protein